MENTTSSAQVWQRISQIQAQLRDERFALSSLCEHLGENAMQAEDGHRTSYSAAFAIGGISLGVMLWGAVHWFLGLSIIVSCIFICYNMRFSADYRNRLTGLINELNDSLSQNSFFLKNNSQNSR